MRKNFAKIFGTVMLAAVCLACGCGDKNVQNNDNKSIVTDAPAPSATPTEEPAVLTDAHGNTEEQAKELISNLVRENTKLYINYFSLGSLPYEGDGEPIDIDKDYVRKVKPEYYASYADFENEIRSVYTVEKAEYLLYEYKTEDMWGDGDTRPMYFNVDGDLYINVRRVGGRGYYVNWEEFSVEISEVTAEGYNFIVHTTVTWPAEVPQPEAYDVSGTAIYENGGLRLATTMF